jgi:hypothetical protein
MAVGVAGGGNSPMVFHNLAGECRAYQRVLTCSNWHWSVQSAYCRPTRAAALFSGALGERGLLERTWRGYRCVSTVIVGHRGVTAVIAQCSWVTGECLTRSTQPALRSI